MGLLSHLFTEKLPDQRQIPLYWTFQSHDRMFYVIYGIQSQIIYNGKEGRNLMSVDPTFILTGRVIMWIINQILKNEEHGRWNQSHQPLGSFP